jgi:hypothetical protein
MRTASQIKFSASLIEDYRYTTPAPVGSYLYNTGSQGNLTQFVVVQKPHDGGMKNEIVTFDQNGQTVWFAADPDSASGYTQTTVPFPAGLMINAVAKKLTAFYYKSRFNVIICGIGAATGRWGASWMQYDGTTWSAVDGGGIANLFASTSAYAVDVVFDAQGNAFVYGMTYTGTLYIIGCNGNPDAWQPVFTTNVSIQFSHQYRTLIAGVGGDALTAIWPALESGNVQYVYQGIQEVGGTYQWSSASPTSFGFNGLGQLLAVPPKAPGQVVPDLIYNSFDGTVTYIAGFNSASPQFLPITTNLAGAPLWVTVGRDGRGDLILFTNGNMLIQSPTEEAPQGSGYRQTVQVLRQSGSDKQGNPTFGHWIPLGPTTQAISSGPKMPSGPEAFYIDQNQQIIRLTADVNRVDDPPVGAAADASAVRAKVDGSWFIERIDAPIALTQVPVEAPSYVGQFKVLDSDNSPVGGCTVSVVADREATLIVNGKTHSVRANAANLFTADIGGTLSVTVPATNLTAPLLTATVPGTTAAKVARFDLQVHHRLAGNDPSFPINKTTLMASGLIATQDQGLADQLATAVRSVGQTLVAMSDPTQSREERIAKLAKVEVQHWRLDFSHPGKPTFEVLTREQALQYLDRSPVGGLGDWLSDRWGDVCSFVENTVDEFVEIVVSIVDDVVDLAIDVANDIKRFALSTLNQVGDLLETIFVKISEGAVAVEQAIGKAVDWVKMVFDWSDIINTQKVLGYYISSVMTQTASSILDAIPFVQNGFGSAKTGIATAMGQLQTYFSSTESFNDYAVASNGGKGGPHLLNNQAFRDAQLATAPQSEYLNIKLGLGTEHPSLGSALPDLAADENPTFTELVTTIIAKMGNDLVEAFEGFETVLKQFFESKESFFSATIQALIGAATEAITLILNIVEDIIVAILQAASTLIQGVEGALSTPVNLPFISWLFGKFADGQPLTVINFVSFLVAVPTTILYKVVFGGASATAPFSDAQVNYILSHPIPWPSFDPSGTFRPLATAVADDSNALGIQAGFNATLWCVWGLFDCWLTFWACTAAEGARIVPLTSWISLGMSAILIGAGTPLNSFTFKTKADTVTTALWAAWIVPFIADALSLRYSSRKAVTRFDEQWGQKLRSVFGFGLLGAAVGTVPVLGGGALWSILGNMISPVTLCATAAYPGLKRKLVPSAVLAAGHLITDFGVGYTILKGAVDDETATPSDSVPASPRLGMA